MREISGRRLFGLLAPIVIVLTGLVGGMVGAHAAARGEAVAVFGLVTLPASPPVVALAAAAWGAGFLGLLYGLVELASRADDAAV